VLDHGAGTGSLSSALLNAGARTLVVVEPDPELVTILRQRFGGQSNVEVVPGTLDAYLRDVGPESVDCIVSANVLEHIEDDRACLATMRALLRPNGSVCLYVPARPELYGTLDHAVGHHRRYTRGELTEKLAGAGFDVRRAEYRNLVGVLPWLVAGRIMKKQSVGRTSIRLVDRVVVPLCCSLENVVTPPYGLNLVAIAVRSTP
jgi:SAM-dependent methyltransferase